MITDCLGFILVLIGTAFMLLSAVGALKMPDLYLRMSASSKTSTLGVASILLGAVFFFLGDNQLGVTTRALAVLFFILMTAPVAAHMLGRAAYYSGVTLWDKTECDEMHGQYNPESQTLDSQCRPSPSEE